MTWEEFLSYMENHYDRIFWVDTDEYICISSEGNHFVRFYKNGDICVVDDKSKYEMTVAEYRTYEQMIKIIEGLLK